MKRDATLRPHKTAYPAGRPKIRTIPYIFQDLLYAQVLAKYAYVKGVGATPMSKPRKGLHDDPYFTDGGRIVLWISGDRVSFTDVEHVKWDMPSEWKK